jgi:hypothetical protein
MNSRPRVYANERGGSRVSGARMTGRCGAEALLPMLFTPTGTKAAPQPLQRTFPAEGGVPATKCGAGGRGGGFD